MTSLAIIAGTAVVAGAGATMYAANKNSKAIDNANKTNAQIAADANAYNYNMWLESKGVAKNADGSTSAVNTKLPRWMMMRTNAQPTPRRLIKKGESSMARSSPYDNLTAAPIGQYGKTIAEYESADTAPDAAKADAGKTSAKNMVTGVVGRLR